MKTRHLLAVLAVTAGMVFVSACGDDNDTRERPVVLPTNTWTPTRTATERTVVLTPTPTNTVGTGATFTPTPTRTQGTGGLTAEFTCDVETSQICVGGPNDGQACRPPCHLASPDVSCRPDEANFCGGGTCSSRRFFCKGGLKDGDPCVPPRVSSDPDPCGEGGRCQNSELTICTELACPTVNRPVSGNTRVHVTCDEGVCRGGLLLRDANVPFSGFDPVVIAGIGNICVRPATPDELTCPDGRAPCVGGEPLDYDLIQDHNIGPCSETTVPKGNEKCKQDCEEHCRSFDPPRIVADSGCAGFCEGGTRDGELCECDRNNIQCSGPACPEGSCVGKDNPEPQNRDICGCQCLETGGSPSGVGGLNFQIPAQIIVESDADPLCGIGPVLITLPPQCIPFTTERMSGRLINANNTTGRQIPPVDCMQGGKLIGDCIEGKLVRQGNRVACEVVETGDVSAMNIVGNISFFDSAIGDIEVELDWECR